MNSEVSAQPTTDYLDVLWRHRVLIIVAVCLGVAVGGVLMPRVANGRTHTATQRVSVAPLSGESLPTSSSSTTGSSGSNSTRRYGDLAAMQQALTTLGARAADLSSTQSARPANRASAALNALSAKPVTGTNLVDLSFKDKHAKIAQRALSAYVAAYIARRNAADTRHVSTQLAAVRQQAHQQFRELARLAARADSQRAGQGVTLLTQAQLQTAEQRYQSTQAAADLLARKQASTASASTAGPIVVTSGGGSSNRWVLGLAGAIVGLLFGLFIALMSELLRRRVLNVRDVEEVTGLPVIAAVPARTPRGLDVVRSQPLSPAAEAYHRARAGLELAGLGDEARILAVLGAEQDPTTSAVALNIAESMADQGIDVVLVSGDTRTRQLEQQLSIGDRPGLLEVIAGGIVDVRKVLVPMGPHLQVLPAGRRTSGSSERVTAVNRADLDTVLARLAEDKVIIIDTPPVLRSGEALTLAAAADGCIIAARAKRSTRADLAAVTQLLDRYGMQAMGVVLLGADERARSGGGRRGTSAPKMVGLSRHAAPSTRANVEAIR